MDKFFALNNYTICLSLIAGIGRSLPVNGKHEFHMLFGINFVDKHGFKCSAFIVGPLFISLRKDYNYGSHKAR